MRTLLLIMISLLLTAVCTGAVMAAAGSGEITKASFGQTTDTQPQAVDLYTLKNASGAECKITNYGGIVVSIVVPDKNGKMADVVLGYDKLADYLRATPYFGAIIGRYGNRIGDGKFTLDGKTYQLAKNNNGVASLHGGNRGFDKVVWTAKPRVTPNGPSLELTYTSKDGEEGFPGTLQVKAIYVWTDKNELRLMLTATTDKPTIVNLTNHSYFNLAGAGSGDNLKHRVMIAGSKFLPVDKNLIPTGELKPVAGTPFDFLKPHAIGERINEADEQLKLGGGYDHCWAIDKPATGDRPALMARVTEPTSGRTLDVMSTAPGLQFYSGNFLNGSNIGKGGIPYQHRYAFCMEPELFPDSPNKPEFKSPVLRPGETYKHTMVYRFGVAKPGAAGEKKAAPAPKAEGKKAEGKKAEGKKGKKGPGKKKA